MGWRDKPKNKKDETKGAGKEKVDKATADDRWNEAARATRA